MLKGWKILKKETAFKNKWRQVDGWRIKLPDGSENDFYFAVSNDFAVIIALTTDKKIVLISQYFIYHDARFVSLPGGYIDSVSALETAKRELMEETGYSAKEWIELGTEQTGKWSSNKVHFMLAIDAYKSGEQNLEPNEDIQVMEKNIAEVKKMLKEGQLGEIYAIAGLYLALDHLNEL